MVVGLVPICCGADDELADLGEVVSAIEGSEDVVAEPEISSGGKPVLNTDSGCLRDSIGLSPDDVVGGIERAGNSSSKSLGYFASFDSLAEATALRAGATPLIAIEAVKPAERRSARRRASSPGCRKGWLRTGKPLGGDVGSRESGERPRAEALVRTRLAGKRYYLNPDPL